MDNTKRIADILRRGSGNAIRSEVLEQYFKVTNRELRQRIHNERVNGALILSKNVKGGGYFLPETKEEVAGYIQDMEMHIESMERALKSAKEYLMQ